MLLDLSLDRCGRAGVVPRARLVSRLARGGRAPLVGIVAPAGFGKTCLLLDWQRQDGRMGARLALQERDNDPQALRARIVGALAGERRRAVAASEAALLLLDDAGCLVAPAAFAVLLELASELPAGSQIAFATRTEPPLPLSGLRARRALIELRSEDLAFDRHETTMLLRALGLRLGRAEIEALRASTEGWPVAVYLAALTIRGSRDPAAAARRFSGADHTIADYLRDELLAPMSEADRDLLLAASVLEQASGSACDALLRREGSAAILAALAHDGLVLPVPSPPLEAVDAEARSAAPRTRHATPARRYRCRALLRQALLAELREQDPERELKLHRRASEWHARTGDCDATILHALAAGETGRAAATLWAEALRRPSCLAGEELDRRLSRFAEAELASSPELATLMAHSRLAAGDLGAAERWALVAEEALDAGAATTERGPLHVAIAILHALATGRHDLGAMAAEAAAARELDGDGRWRALCGLIEGTAHHLAGDRALAASALEHALSEGGRAGAEARARALAQLALLAFEERERERGESLAERACSEAAGGLGLRTPGIAIVPAVLAWVRIGAGRAAEAKLLLHQAQMLLAEARDPLPCFDAQARLVLARAAVPLGEIATARELLAGASRGARQTPGAAALLEWLQEAWSEVDAASALALSGAAQLTLAELRVLRMLTTHLSFAEIASRLHVSRNTVKTQARSVYRKLEADSRSQAVARASEIGLVQ